MLNKVLSAVNRFSMFSAGDSVTVALSGGADSMALLDILYKNRDRFGIKLSAAHLNHTLRGEESDRDEAFVREYCKKIGVTLTVERADVATYAAESGKSIEQAARDIRYDFFSRASSGKTATAHTASDNAETVFINLSRGSALKGMCGIPPVRDEFIRPLIFCTRAEIEEYCRVNEIPFVTDSTNLTDDYTRNKIRHNIIPAMADINPAFCDAVTRFTLAAGEDSAFLEQLADEEFGRCFKNGTLTVSEETSPSLAKRLIARFLEDFADSSADSLHINELYNALGSDTLRSISGGKTVSVKGRNISLFCEEVELSYTASMQMVDRERFEQLLKVNKLLLNNAIDCDKICGKVVLRTRAEGDSIKLKGRGTKSLKKLYNEMKIPQNARVNLPVAADDCGVVWICGAGVSERVKIDKTSKQILVFDCERK